jgi:hypothetical protein
MGAILATKRPQQKLGEQRSGIAAPLRRLPIQMVAE